MIWSLLCWPNDSSSVQDDSLSQQCAIPDALLYPSAKLPWSSAHCRLAPTLALAHCGARWSHPEGRRRSLHPIRVRTCKAASKCVERIPRILRLGPGGLARCWVPGREGRGARGNRLPTQQLTPPLIFISSYSHKPNCLTFQHGSHVNRVFLVVSSKSASFCLEGEVGHGEDVALTKPQPQCSHIWYLVQWREKTGHIC